MSLTLDFEPHSWYKGFAIQHMPLNEYNWYAYTDNGMTGFIDEEHANTLKELKELITRYDDDRKAHIAYLYREETK